MLRFSTPQYMEVLQKVWHCAHQQTRSFPKYSSGKCCQAGEPEDDVCSENASRLRSLNFLSECSRLAWFRDGSAPHGHGVNGMLCAAVHLYAQLETDRVASGLRGGGEATGVRFNVEGASELEMLLMTLETGDPARS